MPAKKLSVNSDQWSVKPSLRRLLHSVHCSLTTVHSSAGVSSMMVLIVVVLLLVVFWEAQQFGEQFISTGYPGQTGSGASGIGKNCIGSQTAFDCYDQDEGTDFVDKSATTAPEPLIFSWRDDGKP